MERVGTNRMYTPRNPVVLSKVVKEASAFVCTPLPPKFDKILGKFGFLCLDPPLSCSFGLARRAVAGVLLMRCTWAERGGSARACGCVSVG